VFVRRDSKSLPGTTLYLLQKFINYGQENFLTLGPGVHVIKLFSLSQMVRQNKLECLTKNGPFQTSLSFDVNLQGDNIWAGFILDLPKNCYQPNPLANSAHPSVANKISIITLKS
jgi:hypothetical protein